MRVQTNRNYAILTGDVVGSSKLAPADRRGLQRAFEGIDRDLRQHFPEPCPLTLEVFRGDSWQLLVVSPESALRIALYVRAALRVHMDRPIDTRVSIGVGWIQFIPKGSVTQGDGPAYRLSGSGLDEMPRQTRLSLRRAASPGSESRLEPDESSPGDDVLDALLATVDALSRHWTASQSQAVMSALTGRTQEVTAAEWRPDPISQQAVAQHLGRARWSAVERALRAFHRYVGAVLTETD